MQTNRRYLPFAIAGLAILTIFLTVVAGAYITGNWIPTQDSVISELGICLQDDVYKQTPTVPVGTASLQVCGMVNGTTNLVGVLYLYHDRNRKMVESRVLTLSPGAFFVTLALPVSLEEGSYSVSFSREKITRIESVFTVQ